MYAAAALWYFGSLQQHNTNTRREDRFFKGANHSLVFANRRHSVPVKKLNCLLVSGHGQRCVPYHIHGMNVSSAGQEDLSHRRYGH